MALVWNDLVETNTAVYSKEGWKATRLFTSQDTEQLGSGTVYALLTSGQCPQRGDPHPDIPNLSADVITGELKDPTTAQITVQYSVLSAVTAEPGNNLPALLTFGSSVQSQDTNVDSDGDQLIDIYDGSAGDLFDQFGNPLSTSSNSTVSAQVPTSCLRFMRRELTTPDVAAGTYVGYINEDDFAAQMLTTTFPPKTILCTRVDGETQDEGVSFIVTYEFIFNPHTWDVGSFYIPPVDAYNEDGKLVAGSGQVIPTEAPTIHQIYGTLSFSPLNL